MSFITRSILACALWAGGLLLTGLMSFAAAQAAQPPPKSERKETQIGDVQIQDFDSVRGKTDLSGVRLLGSKTIIIVPDKKSGSTLRLHADDIQTQKEKNDIFGVVALKANIRYTVLQKTDREERVLEGTAGSGVYRRATQQLELTGGVRATLSDKSRLETPALLRAQKVTVDMSVSPYRYLVEGDAANNEIRFTPRKQEAASSAPGEIRLYGYRTGTFRTGEKMTFSGGDVTAEIAQAEPKTSQSLRSAEIEVSFTGDGRVIQRVVAAGNARYRSERAAPKDGAATRIEGSSDRAEYDASEGRIRLTGSVQATLTAPDSLLEPATLRADLVVTQTIAPYRYEISGSPKRTLIVFTPRPRAPAAAPKPATDTKAETAPARVFSFGTIRISGFDSGTYEPGKEAAFVGGSTLFRSADAAVGTLANLQAGRVVAAFSADRVLERAEATENVRFRIEQPAPSGKTRQSVFGTAHSAVFTNDTKSRGVEMRGPMRADIEDSEHLAEIGHITGETGDILRLNLAAEVYEFDIESPQQTAKLDFVPKQREAEGDKSKKAEADKTKPTKKKP